MVQSVGFSRAHRVARARVSGVYRGWWVAAAASAASLADAPFVNPVLGVFISPLQDEFGWSRGTIAGGLAVGTLAGAAITPIVGPLLDRYGGRILIAGASAIMAICLLLLSQVTAAWQYYLLYGTGRALVIGVVQVAVTVTIANWFIRDRGRATSLQLLGGRGGMAFMPLIALVGIAAFGWRGAFAMLAVLSVLAGLLPALLIIRRRPEDVGLLPDGDVAGAAPRAVKPNRRVATDAYWPVRAVVRTPAFWLLVFGSSQVFVVSGAVNLSMIPHFEDQGLSTGVAVTVVTVWALVGIAGGMLGGEAIQRYGVRLPLSVSLVLTGIGLFWLIYVDSAWSAYGFALFHGTAFGAQMPLTQLVYSEYFGRWTLGAISGITMPIQWLLGAGGPFIASAAFDIRGSYDVIFWIYVGASLMGAVLVFLARPPTPPHSAGRPAPTTTALAGGS